MWSEIARIWLPSGVGIAYLLTACGYFYEGQRGLGVMWFSYALANVGFLLSVKNI